MIANSRWHKIQARERIDIKKATQKYPELKARILGFLAGDGSVQVRTDKARTTHHDIVFYPDHESLVLIFIDAFARIYGKDPTVRKCKGFFSVRVSSKSACADLRESADFGVLNWNVPVNFLISSEFELEWLKAYFDCEGYVGKKNIQLQTVNKKGLLNVQQLLLKHDIDSRIYEYKRQNPKWNINYLLFINKKSAIKTFFKKVCFNHSVKARKLKELSASVPEPGNGLASSNRESECPQGHESSNLSAGVNNI